MRLKVVHLNVMHTRHQRPIPDALATELLTLKPDVLILTEYVERTRRDDWHRWLHDAGLKYTHCSEAVAGFNQVFAASRAMLESLPVPEDCPIELGPQARISLVRFRVDGMIVAGMRPPDYEPVRRYTYWDWVLNGLAADAIIGDLNFDRTDRSKRHRYPREQCLAHGWDLVAIDGLNSFFPRNGRGASCLDHILIRPRCRVTGARYVKEPFVPTFTDHAALVADLEMPNAASAA